MKWCVEYIKPSIALHEVPIHSVRAAGFYVIGRRVRGVWWITVVMNDVFNKVMHMQEED